LLLLSHQARTSERLKRQAAWTEHSAAGALLVAGFSQVHRREYGRGELKGVDGHHRDVGPELALLESTILEARK
jgi:hypothetical protein